MSVGGFARVGAGTAEVTVVVDEEGVGWEGRELDVAAESWAADAVAETGYDMVAGDGVICGVASRIGLRLLLVGRDEMWRKLGGTRLDASESGGFDW